MLNFRLITWFLRSMVMDAPGSATQLISDCRAHARLLQGGIGGRSSTGWIAPVCTEGFARRCDTGPPVPGGSPGFHGAECQTKA